MDEAQISQTYKATTRFTFYYYFLPLVVIVIISVNYCS